MRNLKLEVKKLIFPMPVLVGLDTKKKIKRINDKIDSIPTSTLTPLIISCIKNSNTQHSQKK